MLLCHSLDFGTSVTGASTVLCPSCVLLSGATAGLEFLITVIQFVLLAEIKRLESFSPGERMQI